MSQFFHRSTVRFSLMVALLLILGALLVFGLSLPGQLINSITSLLLVVGVVLLLFSIRWVQTFTDFSPLAKVALVLVVASTLFLIIYNVPNFVTSFIQGFKAGMSN